MVQLPYLQPFDDVNKRVSRLAAHIPFIKGNLTPLSFTEVPRDLYTDAILGVYELNKVDLLRDVFVWAYERSAARYAAVRQSLGEPDPFRLRHRSSLREIIGGVIRKRMGRKEAAAYIASWTKEHLGPDEQERFREMAESELLSLHEGNFARYQVTPAEFEAWRGSQRLLSLLSVSARYRYGSRRSVKTSSEGESWRTCLSSTIRSRSYLESLSLHAT